MSGKITEQLDGSPARRTDELAANRGGVDRKLPVSAIVAAPLGSVEYTDDHTLTESDIGKVLYMNKATAVQLVIPEDNTGFDPPEDNVAVIVIQKGAGQVSIVGDTTSMIINHNQDFAARLAGRYSVAALIKETVDTWYLFGDLEAV